MKTFSIKPSDEEALNYIVCPVCGNNIFSPYWDCDGFSYVRCDQCSLIMQNPQPVFEALDNRYDNEYFKYEQENDQLFFDLMLKGLADVNFSPLYNSAKGEKSFLDIGCATGLLVEHMKKHNWNARGVELCGPAAEYGSLERNIEIFSGTVEQACYDDCTFDVVHCSHLIEHLNNPDAFMDEVYRILKPGGLFLCITPNAASLQGKLFGYRWRSAIADHMFLFSSRTLKRLLKKKDFSIVNIETWGGLGQGYGPFWLKKRLDFLAKKFRFGDVMIMAALKK